MPAVRVQVAAESVVLVPLADSLRAAGFSLEMFGNPRDLVEAAKSSRPDVVIIFARPSQQETATEFRALLEGLPPPAIVIVPAREAASRADLLQAGFADVLVAPFRPRALAARVLELSGGGRLRVATRHAAALPLSVERDGRAVAGRTFNVSRDGLGAELGEALAPGIFVRLAVQPAGRPTVRVFARVVHCRPTEGVAGSFVAGLRFLALSPEEEESVEALVREATASQPALHRLDDTPRPGEAPAGHLPRSADAARARGIAAAAIVTGLAVAAIVGVRAGVATADLPSGVEEIRLVDRTAIVRLGRNAGPDLPGALVEVRRRGALSGLVIDADGRPVTVLDAAAGTTLVCGVPLGEPETREAHAPAAPPEPPPGLMRMAPPDGAGSCAGGGAAK